VKMKILLALLIVSCLVVSFGFHINALSQQSLRTKTLGFSSFKVLTEGNSTDPNGGGEVPGGGVPR
jgi:hypothetical protein